MKTRILLFLSFAFLSATILTFTGCKKYEDGPRFSLSSKKGRITNQWQFTEKIVNGQPQQLTNITVRDIKRDGAYILTVGTSTDETGKWEFSSDKESITFIPDDDDAYSRDILRLKSNELWLEYRDGSDIYEYHYRKN